MLPPTEGITGGWSRGAQPLSVAEFTTRVEIYTLEGSQGDFYRKSLTSHYVQHAVKSALPTGEYEKHLSLVDSRHVVGKTHLY